MVKTTNRDQQKEKVGQIIRYILASVIFIGAMAAIVIGQKQVGPKGLCLMLGGVAALIFLLYMYNRKFK